MEKDAYVSGIKDAFPTALGYISIGLAFGVVASASGLSALEVGLMSALIYGGSAQFAFCALIVTKADLATITITVFLVNLRNMLMSLHATTFFPTVTTLNGIGIASLITDESYGVLLGKAVHSDTIDSSWMHGNNCLSYLAWISATVIGTLLGNTIPNPRVFGLDFALIAMFVGLLTNQFQALRTSITMRKIALISLAISLAFILLSIVFSEAITVLIATLIGCFVGVILDGNQ